MPTVTLYISKADAEIVNAMRDAIEAGVFAVEEPSLSAWTVKVWRDSLLAAGRWPVENKNGVTK